MSNELVTDEEREELAAAIADILQDSAWGIATPGDREMTAKLIVARIDWRLEHLGWMPPAKTERILGRIRRWCMDMAKLPEHHINRSVLNSQMLELAQILNDDH